MPPTKCPHCGGSDFVHNRFVAGLAAFPRGWLDRFRDMLEHCSICLACGHVCHYVDDAALAKLRARNPGWKRPETEV